MTITLSPDQEYSKGILTAFLTNPTKNEIVLSGAAGTGKTTLVKQLLADARDPAIQAMLKLLTGSNGQLNTFLTATTNKAAKVLSDATGEETTTIHSLLGLIPKNNYKTGKTDLILSRDAEIVENCIIYIDESSMIGKDLLQKIRERTYKCKLIFIEDNYQLPPVFEKNSAVFTSVPDKTKLTNIQRQAADNPIIEFAELFRKAQDGESTPVLKTYGEYVLHVDKPTFQKEINAAFTSPHSPEDYKILAWTNKRVHQYNDYVRELLGLPSEYQKGEILLTNNPIIVDKGGQDTVIHPTDSLVYIENTKISAHTYSLSPEIQNAIQEVPGQFVELSSGYNVYLPNNMNAATAHLNHFKRHNDWKSFFACKNFFVDLRHIHSSTITKSQGSTYKVVFIDVNDIANNTKNLEILRLMYTAITRASYRVVMCGELPPRMYT